MIHGYHVIMPCYGFWLPNDPRGSWSDFVARWELLRYGESTRKFEQRTLAQLTVQELAIREAARAALLYEPVCLTGRQALSIASGFAKKAASTGYKIWACAIMPQHIHLVIARHQYKVEQVANLLKGAATKQLIGDGLHPLEKYARPNRRPPGMWARHQWKKYLDSDAAIENAIAYVIENPLKEGKKQQTWNFITPYAGLDPGLVTYL